MTDLFRLCSMCRRNKGTATCQHCKNLFCEDCLKAHKCGTLMFRGDEKV